MSTGVALRTGGLLRRFGLPLLGHPCASLLQKSSPSDRGTSTLPEGHRKSDLRDVMCNIRLSRLRDITLRRDVSLYDEGTPVKLIDVFKGKRALLVGIPGGKVCCQEHLPAYLNKVCFYEDKDLTFARMLGLERDDGPKTQRFAAVINDGLLLRMNVEKHPREVKETSYDVLLDIWKQFCSKQ